jgi:bifunctional non-homologous end joining protein LigD
MTLDRYRRKRRFDRTAEPRGADVPPAAKAETDRGRYVVQRHRATRLHYDVRIELGGVLVSWAVPRGPSLDPKARRLAVHVEDHPVEYFAFEGTIPGREYGAGDVIVWDWGRWTADPENPDAARALDRGELKLTLEGEKLHGAFVLFRTDWREGSKEQWLLIHRRDEAAVPGWDSEQHPLSVKTGRTNDEVADGVAPKMRKRGPRRK